MIRARYTLSLCFSMTYWILVRTVDLGLVAMVLPLRHVPKLAVESRMKVGSTTP